MERPTTITPKDDPNEHDKELQRVLDRVLSHREAMRDSASWPILDRTIQSRRRARSHTTMERLKELLVDLDSLQDIREQGRKRLIDPVNIVPTTNCTSEAVPAVFAVPELLEAILLHLPLPDLLRAEDTCRIFRVTIAASPALRQRLFRESNVNMRYRTPGYLGPCDLGRRQHGHQIHVANGVEGPHASRNRSDFSCFIARFITVDGTLPELRDRVMDMFVSQPPVTSVHFSLACCDTQEHDLPGGERATSIERTEGLRIRDLYDLAALLFHEHRSCPQADRELHDWNGNIDNTITFWGYFKQSDSAAARDVVERYENDPAWRPHIEYAAKCQEMDARLDAYIAGKLIAQEHGESIPTFEEFEARSVGQTPDL
ncbi:hypothetical protein LTR56_000171 [Elasticomyces elasticus]|nr:hypothetical protein LTR56_000171 [Elasticomyces elasticus]KAK3667159.1 hypothetical protein LTR22_002024 [Elasticomyces elasticus]KAK4932933.1 hypothetical protein LTR49_000890 [Elasticomyces elasticus]KAK5768662.1 hypothetical protein LTS12_001087 [Elasticomyces elasticus]